MYVVLSFGFSQTLIEMLPIKSILNVEITSEGIETKRLSEASENHQDSTRMTTNLHEASLVENEGSGSINETQTRVIRVRRSGDVGFTNLNPDRKKWKGKSGRDGGGKGRRRRGRKGRKKKGKRKKKRGRSRGKKRPNLQRLRQNMERMSKSSVADDDGDAGGKTGGEKRRAVIYSVFGLLCLFI